jgi:hypothetical protein
VWYGREARVEEQVIRVQKFACVGAILLMASGMAAAGASNEKSSGAMVFDQLKTLVGEWEGKNESGPVKITYTLVSGGTALMERMQPANEAEMITMYSADGDKVLVTHYCSAGYQPSMKTETLKGAGNKYSFSLVNVSGLKSPDDGHMVGLVLTLVDKDHLTQEWKYWNKGKTSAELFEYRRKPEKAATIVPNGN